jgi:hypothetical protein
MHTHKKLTAIFSAVFTIAIASTTFAQEKLKTEDVISKHLSAIGPTEALSATKSIIAVGDAKALSRSTAVRDVVGVSQVVSEGEKVVLAMVFTNSNNYPYEKAGYDGKKMTVALLETTGQRSALTEFLASQQAIFKEGLIGGTLSSAWPLLNVAAKEAKLSYSGTKKLNDRLVHEVKYSTRKSDMKVSLFFDAETFQHVRTEYSYQTSARMGTRPSSGPIATSTGATSAAGTDTGSQTLNRYKLVEEFSDFKTEGQLTLPHTYKLRLTVDAQRTLLLEWVMNFKQFTFNEQIDDNVFNVSVTK